MSTPFGVRRRTVGFRSLLGLCIALFMALLLGAPASALCNGLQYLYAGEVSQSLSYDGVERYVSVPSSRLSNYNSEHIGFWLDVDDEDSPRNQCNSLGFSICWVQAGHGMGAGGGGAGVQTHLVTYYENVSPVTGYSFTWFPGVSLSQNDFYTVYYSGTHDSQGHPYYEAYVNTGSGNQFLGETAVSGSTAGGGNSQDIQAQAEMESDPGITACPRIDINNAYQYFGTNGSGTATSSTALYNTFDSSTWSEWTGAVNTLNNYEMGFIRNHSAFRTRGGGD